MEKTEITGKDNQKIKHLKKLSSKKYREEFGEFTVENFTIIKDGATAGFKPISVFATASFVEKHESELTDILKKTDNKFYFEIDERINKQFSNLKTPPGICAVYELPEKGSFKTDKHIAYLNSIGDTGNMGTILRSALAFNIETVVLDETCADPYNYKCINAAKDAIFKIRIVQDKDMKILQKIKKNMKIVSTRVFEAKNIDDFDIAKPFCMVLGDESRGVSDKIQNMSDEFVKIKMNPEIESLNVASVAAIIFNKIYSTK